MRILLLLSLSYFSTSVLAQQLTFDWVRLMPGVDDAASITTCVDNSGNSITAGYYRNTVDFNVLGGGYPLTTNGNNEIFIRKDEPNGNFI